MSQSSPQQDRLRARVLSSVANDAAPVRSALSRRTVIALVAGATGAGVFAATGRHAPTPGMLWLSGTAILLAIAAAATGLTATRWATGWLRAARAVCVAVVTAAGAIAASSVWATDPFAPLPARVHAACALMTVGLGAALALALFVARRGTEPLTPARAGFTLGGILGLWSAALVAVRCGHAEIDHLLGAHLAPIAALFIAGIVLGRRLLAPRAAVRARSEIDVR